MLGSFPFDDGQCYQDNDTPIAAQRRELPQRKHLDVEGNGLWCGCDVLLPEQLEPGSIYTLYWIWDFRGVGFLEFYSTCMDIEIIA
jgi:hypothetical protein